MKTAVSLPDPVFHEAEQLAKRLRVPRSRLYATAIASFVKQHRRRGVTEALNAVYGDDAEQSKLDPILRKLQERSVSRGDW